MSAAHVDPALVLRRRALRRSEGKRRLAVLVGVFAILLLPGGYWALEHSSVFSASQVAVTGATPRVDALVRAAVARDVAGHSLLQVNASALAAPPGGAARRARGPRRPRVPAHGRGHGRPGARRRVRPRRQGPLRGLGRRPRPALAHPRPGALAAVRPAGRPGAGGRPHDRHGSDCTRRCRCSRRCRPDSSATSPGSRASSRTRPEWWRCSATACTSASATRLRCRSSCASPPGCSSKMGGSIRRSVAYVDVSAPARPAIGYKK